MQRIAVALMLLLVCMASAAGQTPPAKKATGLKTVGVISVIGDRFTVRQLGFTVFGNEENEVAIDAWGIDEAVAAKATAVLGKRYSVKRIPHPKGAFTAYEKPTSTLFRDLDGELQAVVRKVAAAHNCDLYLVVTKTSAPIGSTNQYISGLGILAGGFGPTAGTLLYALSAVRLYDGRTFAVLAEKRATIGQQTFMAFVKGPHREVNSTWWPASPQKAAQDAKLKAALRALVEQSMSVTIPQVLRVD